jgi:creatinine amidohydrolase
MSTSWLANAHPESFWPNHPWPGFAALSADAWTRTLVVLPVHGFADHGLGLPLDAEEIVGSAVLRCAAENVCAGGVALRVLPPLRFALAPYPSARFGVDAETACGQMREIVRSVKTAGFSQIVFFNTSPWNEELVATIALDTRVELGLHNFVINLSKLGASFHPGAAKEARANAQAAAMHIAAQTAKSGFVSMKADVRDANFRPGNFQQPETLAPDEALDGEAIVAALATQLTRALAAAGVGNASLPVGATMRDAAQTRHSDDSEDGRPQLPASARVPVFPHVYRARYLPAFTAAELAAIPGKHNALVIIPTGAVEQHGPHLPVGVDAILGHAWLAHTLPKLPAAAASRVFVAPPVTFGKSNEHDGFPGTITVTAKTLRHVLLALAASLKEMGFRTIAVLNTHGGNSPVIVYTLREIQTVSGLRAGMIKPPLPPGLSAREATLGIHAGQWETALMLACAPELVRMDKAVCEYPPHPLDGLAWMTRDVSKSGVMGDATAATTEQGLRWLDEASAALAKQIAALLPGKNQLRIKN